MQKLKAWHTFKTQVAQGVFNVSGKTAGSINLEFAAKHRATFQSILSAREIPSGSSSFQYFLLFLHFPQENLTPGNAKKIAAKDVNEAWEQAKKIAETKGKGQDELYLASMSKWMASFSGLESLDMPGSVDLWKTQLATPVKVLGFSSRLGVLSSIRLPKRLGIMGSDDRVRVSSLCSFPYPSTSKIQTKNASSNFKSKTKNAGVSR